jgi:hypothetical protein
MNNSGEAEPQPLLKLGPRLFGDVANSWDMIPSIVIKTNNPENFMIMIFFIMIMHNEEKPDIILYIIDYKYVSSQQ